MGTEIRTLTQMLPSLLAWRRFPEIWCISFSNFGSVGFTSAQHADLWFRKGKTAKYLHSVAFSWETVSPGIHMYAAWHLMWRKGPVSMCFSALLVCNLCLLKSLKLEWFVINNCCQTFTANGFFYNTSHEHNKTLVIASGYWGMRWRVLSELHCLDCLHDCTCQAADVQDSELQQPGGLVRVWAPHSEFRYPQNGWFQFSCMIIESFALTQNHQNQTRQSLDKTLNHTRCFHILRSGHFVLCDWMLRTSCTSAGTVTVCLTQSQVFCMF